MNWYEPGFKLSEKYYAFLKNIHYTSGGFGGTG